MSRRTLRARDLLLFAKVSLGEVLDADHETVDRDTIRQAFNCKRVCLLICSPERGDPILAIEHFDEQPPNDLRGRDAVKRRVLEAAGIGLVRVSHHQSEDEVRGAISAALDRRLDRARR